MTEPKVAVLVLTTNEKKFLKEVLSSLFRQTYKNLEIYVLDNNSTDGSIEEIQSLKFKVQSCSLKLKVIRYKSNLGYAKGNNIGLKKAFEEGAEFCLVLNCDTILKKNTVAELVRFFLEKKEKNIPVGLIQPVILLAHDKKRINSVGNVIHYLGFGYCSDFLKKYRPLKKDKEIISVSGAAMFLSKNFYEKVGGFDEDFFMTAEDQDLSWRGYLAGYHHFLAGRVVIFHHYQFGRHRLNKFREEKNRLLILLKNYSTKSLIFLAPILVINELAILIYSLFEGWLFLKIKSYFLILKNLKNILRKRKIIQKQRVVADKILFAKFKSAIYFKPLDNFFIRYLVNPLYQLYYQLVKIFI
jgi:GT2 family glycosyltransferase